MKNEYTLVSKILGYSLLLAAVAVIVLVKFALDGDSRGMTLLMGILFMLAGLSLFVWKSYVWPNWRNEEVQNQYGE